MTAGVAVGDGVVAAPTSSPDPQAASRRTFITAAALVGAGSVAVAVVGRRVRTTDVAAVARKTTVIPRPARAASVPGAQPFTVAGLSPYITPNADFYRIDTALSVPQVDVAGWRLDVKGLVDHPFSITYDELLGMESVEEVVTLQCVSNEVGGDLSTRCGKGAARDPARPGRAAGGAKRVVGRSVDRFTAGFPRRSVRRRPALVAYAMNASRCRCGTARSSRGRRPVRVRVGHEVARLDQLATRDGVDGYWVPRVVKEGPIKTACASTPSGSWRPHRPSWGGLVPTPGIKAVSPGRRRPWQARSRRVASENTGCRALRVRTQPDRHCSGCGP